MTGKSFPFLVVIWAASLLGSGCATTPPAATATPKIARLSAEEMAQLAPGAHGLSLDDLVAMAGSGASIEDIVGRFRQSAARFDLTPAQVVDLHKRGLPLQVLQVIHEDMEKVRRADFTQLLVERDQKCSGEVAQVRNEAWQRARASVESSWPGCYGGWSPYPYRRPGTFTGW